MNKQKDAKRRQGPVAVPAKDVEVAAPELPTCRAVARNGVYDSTDVGNFLSCLLYDQANGLITPHVGNAMCNTIGKMLKNGELRAKYGNQPSQPMQFAERPQLRSGE